MSRYIDADAFFADSKWCGLITADQVLFALAHQPSIDIVFCKECKWFDAGENESDSWHLCTRHFGKYINFAEDDFCSYGEREGD